jgi:GNAT superfamily N-acetyltransferase
LKRVTVPIETLDIIDLEMHHLEGALALSEEAHWNQVKADWQMMIEDGNAIGMAAPDGRIIATALTLPFGNRFGWVSMVLVTADWQKKGLATRLLKACIGRLENARLTPILDATAEGENVYRPLGFLPQYGIQRWIHNTVENIKLKNSGMLNLVPIDLAMVTKIDGTIFGGDRKAVLKNLAARSAEFSCMQPDGGGYLLGRDGRIASNIGPLMTESTEHALIMLDHALANLRGRVYVDAADHQTEFIQRLKDYGFSLQRPFLRMAKGRAEPFGDTVKMFAMAGPELG